MYVATISRPGYLPDSDMPPLTFETTEEAWQYLLGEFDYHNNYAPAIWPTEGLGSHIAADGYAYTVMAVEQ